LQAAKVVAEVLQQSPLGTSVVLEAGVSEAAAPTPISFAVAEVIQLEIRSQRMVLQQLQGKLLLQRLWAAAPTSISFAMAEVSQRGRCRAVFTGLPQHRAGWT